MGTISEQFAQLEFHNEAEVSQNFLLPLLTDFLGFHRSEIQPERTVPSFRVPQNRSRGISSDALPPNIRPDYIVAVGDIDPKILFICDSKGPSESLDNYLNQLIAYCIALGVNLLLTTNGAEFRVYDANELIFQAHDISDLDIKFDELFKLLGRDEAIQRTNMERIQRLDLSRTLTRDSATLREEHQRRVALLLSDFTPYLESIVEAKSVVQLPTSLHAAFGTELQRFAAEEFYSFQEIRAGLSGIDRDRHLSYSELLNHNSRSPLLVIGESGIGKSSLLEQLLRDYAKICLAYESVEVPVLIKLGSYGRSHSLQETVANILIGKGVNATPDTHRSWFRDGRLIILLDAFDELFESNVPDVERELQFLIENYPSTKFIVSSRSFRIPRVAPRQQYTVLPLSQEKVEEFALSYLHHKSGDFLREIEHKRLSSLVSNTLLLTLLVLLYKHYGELPTSRAKLLQTVVGHVGELEQAKPERFSSPLPWVARIKMMASLAVTAIENGLSYTLDRGAVDSTLIRELDVLTQRREIPNGITLHQALHSLAATSFVLNVEGGVVFWHRIFLEHFAACMVAERIESFPEVLPDLISEPEWIDVIPLAIANTLNPSNIIQETLRLNLFVAARGLLECGNTVNDRTYRQVADSLADKCSSQTIPIRRVAIDLLRKLDDRYVIDIFHQMLESPFVDVQKASLVELARRRVPDAHSLVFSRLDWDVNAPTWHEGPSNTAVIEALGELDDSEAHLQIVNMWRNEPDMFTDFSCRNALLAVIRRGMLAEEVKEALLDFFLSHDKEMRASHKLWTLEEVLIAINDKTIATRLFSELVQAKPEKRSDLHLHAVRIFAAYQDSHLIQTFIEKIMESDTDDIMREVLAEVLAKKAVDVPRAILETLARDRSFLIRSHGIRGLGEFQFEDVHEIVLTAIHPPSYEDSVKTGHEYALVQQAAIEVLAKHNKLNLLLQSDYQPQYMYNISVDVLLDSIVQNGLFEMAPLLEDLLDYAEQPPTHQARISCVLASIGHTSRAQEILGHLLHSGELMEAQTANTVLAEIHQFPSEFALSIIDDLLIDSKREQSRRRLSYPCIEALERIGTTGAIQRLIAIAEECVDTGETTLDLERSLRALVSLAPKDKEDWLIDFLIKHPEIERHDLRRSLELLGVIGSKKSIPTLSRYFLNPPRAEVQVTCFWAIHEIHRRNGILWFNNEEAA